MRRDTFQIAVARDRLAPRFPTFCRKIAVARVPPHEQPASSPSPASINNPHIGMWCRSAPRTAFVKPFEPPPLVNSSKPRSELASSGIPLAPPPRPLFCLISPFFCQRCEPPHTTQTMLRPIPQQNDGPNGREKHHPADVRRPLPIRQRVRVAARGGRGLDRAARWGGGLW